MFWNCLACHSTISGEEKKRYFIIWFLIETSRKTKSSLTRDSFDLIAVINSNNNNNTLDINTVWQIFLIDVKKFTNYELNVLAIAVRPRFSTLTTLDIDKFDTRERGGPATMIYCISGQMVSRRIVSMTKGELLSRISALAIVLALSLAVLPFRGFQGLARVQILIALHLPA